MERIVDLLKREAESGFARLAGTRFTGTVPLTEAVLNQAIVDAGCVVVTVVNAG